MKRGSAALRRARAVEFAARALFVVIVAAVIAGLAYGQSKIPCEFYSHTPAKDIPGRCIMGR